MQRSAIVVCGGGPARRPLPPIDAALVIAADGGIEEAERLELRVDLLVGDMDSAPPSAVPDVEATGGRVERYAADKDASDLELALDAAGREGVEHVLVVGGEGGRFDHLLGNALLLGSPRWAALRIDAVLGDALLHVIRGERAFTGTPGEVISLFALGGPAREVVTHGLRWALDGEDLEPGSTRGLSNEFAETRASVSLGEGVLIAIRPGDKT